MLPNKRLQPTLVRLRRAVRDEAIEGETVSVEYGGRNSFFAS
jgi:hypothetical protein